MTAGEKLKMLRRKAGLTQVEFAKILGITCRALQNYEADKATPQKGKVLTKMSETLGVSIDHIFNDKDQTPTHPENTMIHRSNILKDIEYIFSHEDIPETEKEAFLSSINRLYWKHREGNDN